MFGKRLVLAAAVAAAMVMGGLAEAAPAKPKPKVPPPQEDFFDAFGRGLGDLFNGGGGFQGQALYPEDVSRYRVVPSEFRRQTVRFTTTEGVGTIVVDPRAHYLYYILGDGQAVRYGVGVGRTGFGWRGVVQVGGKGEWPAWHPPKEMIAREAQRGHKLPVYMAGGPGNPLGARALYLHSKNGDTGYRIHGTSEPWTIGLNVSSGCIRLVNDDVMDLYKRTGVGTKVVVL